MRMPVSRRPSAQCFRASSLSNPTDAVAENLDIMSVILRSSSEPVLDRAAFQRVQRASVAYAEYKHYRDELSDPEEDEGPDNDDAWLFEDLHVLMRVDRKSVV